MEETQLKKFGIVMEGGGMRGMFTAGVLDAFYARGLHFDGVIGVSAGMRVARQA